MSIGRISIIVIMMLLATLFEPVTGFIPTRQTGPFPRIMSKREHFRRWSILPLNDCKIGGVLDDNSVVQEEVPNTMVKALRRFFFGRDLGPISALSIMISLATSRFGLAIDLGIKDVFAFSCAVVFWWFQEHLLHDRLLHSSKNWFGKEIHQGHHEKPYFHISIDPVELMLGWLLVAHVVFRMFLPLDLALSATVGYSLAGLGYEWSHYIAHTRVRPPTKFFRSMRDNHMKHHLVDSRYWFAFSLPMIDDAFGTNPDVRDIQKIKGKAKKRKEACTVR
mmetsp:Transcript_2126/g.3052  ORF Transcript_2126/g.3052 Transcript_2126/m.3052 type:complete len:278 (+) Transcript_2126:108-941(+)